MVVVVPAGAAGRDEEETAAEILREGEADAATATAASAAEGYGRDGIERDADDDVEPWA